MIDPDEPAFPGQRLDSSGMPCSEFAPGLTIRAHFAAMAMQGFLACDTLTGTPTYQKVAECSVKAADAMIAELNK